MPYKNPHSLEAKQKKHEQYERRKARDPKKHREIQRAIDRRWREENRERWRAAHRRWYANRTDEKKKKHRKQKKIWYLKNKQTIRAYHQKYRETKREAKAGRPKPTCCDVCGKSKTKIEFDHCHQRGIFRGWLCTNCNSILGHARDNPDTLRKLIAYLDRTKILISPQLTLPGI
jgi:hypothetical protein